MSEAAAPRDEPAGWPLRCSADPRRPALAFCTSCVQPFSGPHLGIRDDGRAICHECAEREEIVVRAEAAPQAEGDPVLRDGWIRGLGRLILRPQRAMSERYDGPIGAAVAFGYIATTIGFATTVGWDLTMNGDALIAAITENVPAAAEMGPAEIERMLWLSVPIRAAFRFVVGALLLHLGIGVMMGAQRPQSRETLRVFALASGPLVLCMLPTIGSFVALVLWISACMGYLQTRKGLPMLRGMMALMPALLVITQFGPKNFVP